jgi:hypothetical protein
VTSATLRKHGLEVNIEAAEFTVAGLVKALAAANPPEHAPQ